MNGSSTDLFLGYNYRAGSLVVGGQVEASIFSDVVSRSGSIGVDTLNQTVTGVAIPSSRVTVTGLERKDQLRSNVALIARAGVLVTPDILLYGLGGVTFGNFVYPDGEDQLLFSNNRWAVGYTAGAGGELKLNTNWYRRAARRVRADGRQRRARGTDALRLARARAAACRARGARSTADSSTSSRT